MMERLAGGMSVAMSWCTRGMHAGKFFTSPVAGPAPAASRASNAASRFFKSASRAFTAASRLSIYTAGHRSQTCCPSRTNARYVVFLMLSHVTSP